MRSLVVDGYNLLHAWPRLSAVLRERGLEDARSQLLDGLAAYAARTGVAVTVVFDAHGRGRGEPPSSHLVDGVTVLFGSRGATADHVIERLANRAARAGQSADMVVATNDRLQRALVAAMGVATLSATALVQDLDRVAADVSQEASRQRGEQRRASRVEAQLDAEVVRRLERLRRGQPADDV